MTEVWTQVVNYPEHEISSMGRIRRNRRILSTHLDKNGYDQIHLWWHGKAWHVHVHRLVAFHFIGPRPTGHVINHKDGNRLNNKASNLEYVTHSQNMRHAKQMGLMKHKRRPDKMTWTKAERLRRDYKSKKFTQRDLADKYDISQRQVWNIIARRQWASPD